jgi:hypothetical protein
VQTKQPRPKANHGNKLHQFIAGIAQAAVNQEEQATNIPASMKALTDAMAAQIKAMLDRIPQLKSNGKQKECTKWWWRRQQQWPQWQERQRVNQTQDNTIHQTTQHGLLLLVARVPSSQHKPHKHHLQVVTTQPRCNGNVE